MAKYFVDKWDNEDDVDGDEETSSWSSSTKKSWWSTPQSFSKWTYQPVGSTSAYLRGSFQKSSFDRQKQADKEVLTDVLWEANKTCNLLQNKALGDAGEAKLTVHFSDGKKLNNFSSNSIFISPAVLKDANGKIHANGSDEFFAAADALNGQSLLCGYMKRHVPSPVAVQFQSCQNNSINNIFLTDLQNVSIQEIAKEWPGFQSYVDQVKKVFFANRDETLYNFSRNDLEPIDKFINAMCYNVLNEDKISFHDYFDSDLADRLEKAQDFLNRTLQTEADDLDRHDRATKLVKTITKMIALPSDPPQPQPQNQQGNKNQQSGQGKNQNQQGDQDQQDDEGGQGNDQSQQGGQGDDQNQQGDQSNDQSQQGDQGNDQNQQGGQGNDQSQQGDQGDDQSQQGDQGDDQSQQGDQGDDQSQQDSTRPTISWINSDNVRSKIRQFAGDQSFRKDCYVAGDSNAGEITPNKDSSDKRSVTKNDKLTVMSSPLVDGVNYYRTEPAFKSSMVQEYSEIVRSERQLIRAIQGCFSFQNTACSESTFGLPTGDLDDNSLYKLELNDVDKMYGRRTVKAKKQWLVTLMIDQSGSMEGYKIKQAGRLAIVFAEALKQVRGIEHSIYGWTSMSAQECIETIVYKERNYQNMHALSQATDRYTTPMGYSIAHVSDKMIVQYPECEKKVLFCITDGVPTVHDNRYQDAPSHTKQACDLVRRKGIKVFGVGIANAFSDETGEELFGANNFVVIGDVQNCLTILVSALTKFMKQI